MTLIQADAETWRVSAPEPVGPVDTLLARLRNRARGAAVALGIDCPIGLPRAFAARHAPALPAAGFVEFLRTLAPGSDFLRVAETLAEISPSRPFYPRRGTAGMTRLSHALALGLTDASELCRACDLATPDRPAGAPLFWTLGANQSGKAAISAWRDLIAPALNTRDPPKIWPFDGPLRTLLPEGAIAIAETYPAEALRQLGLRQAGSKRRQPDRAAHAPAILAALVRLGATPDDAASAAIATGFGPDAAGEDRFDCLLGALCVLGVLTGARPDTPPGGAWEGWVLGQSCSGR